MVTDVLNFPASEFCLSGDSLFYYSTEYSKYTGQNTISYGIYDTRKKRCSDYELHYGRYGKEYRGTLWIGCESVPKRSS